VVIAEFLHQFRNAPQQALLIVFAEAFAQASSKFFRLQLQQDTVEHG